MSDLSWLFDHQYACKSALKLVGDRHELTQRQRMAVMRCACSDAARERRGAGRVTPVQLAGEELLLDGYNVLTTIEAALAGGVILSARDGCFRDLASVHGTYRKVAETHPAIELLGSWIASQRLARCVWYLDRPVSNSGRLKTILREYAEQNGWDWRIELVPDPDPILARASAVVATADSVILDRCARWINLAREIVTTCVPSAHLIDLSDTPA